MKTIDKQASGPHTNTLGQKIKVPYLQLMDFKLMTYTYIRNKL